jgi:hypothetical protein
MRLVLCLRLTTTILSIYDLATFSISFTALSLNLLCQRIFELEQELYRVAAIASHLPDEQTVELDLDELIGYGFEVNHTVE